MVVSLYAGKELYYGGKRVIHSVVGEEFCPLMQGSGKSCPSLGEQGKSRVPCCMEEWRSSLHGKSGVVSPCFTQKSRVPCSGKKELCSFLQGGGLGGEGGERGGA